MKAKFILHGGFTPKKQDENNEDFYTEILKDTPQELSILIVPFAKDTDRIAITTKRVMGEFDKYKSEKNISFQIANEESFLEQIKSADIVYFQGGSSLKLLETLKNFQDLKTSLEGKIVAGESAGSNVLGRFFYSPSANGVFEGLGILPIKIIPHYKYEYKDVFKDVGADIQSVFLKEYEHQVFQQN